MAADFSTTHFYMFVCAIFMRFFFRLVFEIDKQRNKIKWSRNRFEFINVGLFVNRKLKWFFNAHQLCCKKKNERKQKQRKKNNHISNKLTLWGTLNKNKMKKTKIAVKVTAFSSPATREYLVSPISLFLYFVLFLFIVFLFVTH